MEGNTNNGFRHNDVGWGGGEGTLDISISQGRGGGLVGGGNP